MPGYIIHLSIASEYIKKHKEKINKQDFLEGVIAPDETKNKSETHYGENPRKTDLEKFLKNNNVDTSYEKGFFLHLLSDYLFYNIYLSKKYEREILHNEYDCVNRFLIEKYNITVPNNVKDKIYFKTEEPKILTKEFVCKLIDEISEYDINETVQEILQEPEKWKKYI